MTAVANGILDRAVTAHQSHGIDDIKAFVKLELTDNFAALVAEPEKLRAML